MSDVLWIEGNWFTVATGPAMADVNYELWKCRATAVGVLAVLIYRQLGRGRFQYISFLHSIRQGKLPPQSIRR